MGNARGKRCSAAGLPRADPAASRAGTTARSLQLVHPMRLCAVLLVRSEVPATLGAELRTVRATAGVDSGGRERAARLVVGLDGVCKAEEQGMSRRHLQLVRSRRGADRHSGARIWGE